MDTLLPILVPSDWPHQGEAVARPLLDGMGGSDLPLVAISQQRQPLLVYLGPERLAWLGLAAAEAETRAIENMRGLPALWRRIQAPTPAGGWLELQVHEGMLASERILDTAELHTLGTERIRGGLALGIPHRGILMATALPTALEGAFPVVVRRMYDDAQAGGATALSPRVFVAEGGTLVGVLA
jgi:hypothetical protein